MQLEVLRNFLLRTLQYFCPLKHEKKTSKVGHTRPIFFSLLPLATHMAKNWKSKISEIGLRLLLLYLLCDTNFTKLLLMYCTWNVHTTNPYITQRIQQWKAHSKLIAVFFAQPTAIFLIATCSFWLVVGTHSTRPKRFTQRWVFKVSIRS